MAAVTEQRIDLSDPVVERSASGALALAASYWDEIARVTLGLVRARIAPTGTELVLARAVPLLRFGPPDATATEDLVDCRFPITGGLLARCPGGSLSLQQRDDPRLELAVVVDGYSPSLDSGPGRAGLRTLAYRALQVRAHELIGRRYLERMAGLR